MGSTVREMIVEALFDSGAFGRGQPPPADAIGRGLKRLNWLLAGWNRKRWLVYQLNTLSKVSTGATFYTVGPTGDFPMAERSDKIDSAYMRQLNTAPNYPVDYPLKPILSREDYNLVRLKTLVTWSSYFYYEPSYPLGKFYPWPITQSGGGYELFVSFKHVLTQYATLEEELALPLEYENAIHWNLVVEFSDNYRKAPSGVAVSKAKDGLNLIRGSYTALSQLHMPGALRRTGANYNIYSDDNA